MIIKYFELNKLDIGKKKFILLHGKNDGLKNEEILKSISLIVVPVHKIL